MNYFKKTLDFSRNAWYNIITVKGNLISKVASAGKEITMEDMNLGEMVRELAEENQTRKILEILDKCKTLDEAREKIKALLNK